ncbi:MAG: hypothetical protein JXR51_10815 [Bacteroidales bacterium]|nr:hypothetical protein [Bacteroidales bacterium]MBN2757659.1 hypothetical protein [Bacteroidales bacterium]
MKILFFTTQEPDYLQDSLLIGLRIFLQSLLIDYPQKEVLYKNKETQNLYGQGFSLYYFFEPIEINRETIKQRIINNEFDIIIFSSIHRQISLFLEYFHILKNKKLVFLDGEDHPSLFGYNGKYWRNPKYWFLPKIHKKYLYFKREYTEETIKYRFYKLLPSFLCKKIKLKNVYPISFSFPDSKIIKKNTVKEKLFPEHIVDAEIAEKHDKKTQYVFNNEKDYFEDLQKSKFGITTKRAGWDAMRHYEIAANNAVMCFKNLDKKDETCAPHGLNKTNSIIYNNYDDLISKINKLSDTEYLNLQTNSNKWILENSCENRAKQVIKVINEFYKS